MANTYTPVPTSAQSPASRPRKGVFPALSLPADGDSLNAASVAQMVKALGDYVAYMNAPSRYEFTENWFAPFATATATTTAIANNPAWTFTISTAGTLTHIPQIYQLAYNSISVAAVSGAGKGCYLKGPAILAPDDNTYFAAEWYAKCTSIDTGGAQVRRLWLAGTPTGGGNGIGFRSIANVGPNWYAVTEDNGSVTATSTGVAVSSASFKRFRVELYGANQTGGALAYFYIDGTLVATHTTNLPYTTLPPSPTTGLAPVFSVENVAGVADMTMTVGPFWASWLVAATQL